MSEDQVNTNKDIEDLLAMWRQQVASATTNIYQGLVQMGKSDEAPEVIKQFYQDLLDDIEQDQKR